MTDETPLMIEQESVMQVLYDLIVDHPMWIGDDGMPLDYWSEREVRIGQFLDAAEAAVVPIIAARVAAAKAEAWQEAHDYCCELGLLADRCLNPYRTGGDHPAPCNHDPAHHPTEGTK